MDHADVERLRDRHPAWRLLRAGNAPLVLAFLGGFFVEGNNGATSASALAAAGQAPSTSPQLPELHRASGLDLADLHDNTDRQRPYGRIRCRPRRGTTQEQLLDRLTQIYGVHTTVDVALPRPLPAIIPAWVRNHQDENLPTSLAALETAIASPNPSPTDPTRSSPEIQLQGQPWATTASPSACRGCYLQADGH